jgi:hypothetical protein
MLNCSFFSEPILICKIYFFGDPGSEDVLHRGLLSFVYIFYLLPCPGHAGRCGDSMRGVPDVHNFFSSRS